VKARGVKLRPVIQLHGAMYSTKNYSASLKTAKMAKSSYKPQNTKKYETATHCTTFTVIPRYTGKILEYYSYSYFIRKPHNRRARLTRQLSYRKEDRAMRPIYGCTEKF